LTVVYPEDSKEIITHLKKGTVVAKEKLKALKN
jgi:hypothetical protein